MRPTSALGKRGFFRSGTWRPMSWAQELWLALAKAAWPLVPRPRGNSLPPTRPAAWPSFLGGGRVGIPPELPRRRPTCFGSDRKGRVGGAVSRAQQWRPVRAGSGRTVTNRTTSAASKLIESCNHWRPEPQGGQRSGHQSCGCGFHCTLAAGATPVRLVSPTHPPCSLAPPYGGGRAGIPPELQPWPPMCFGSGTKGRAGGNTS